MRIGHIRLMKSTKIEWLLHSHDRGHDGQKFYLIRILKMTSFILVINVMNCFMAEVSIDSLTFVIPTYYVYSSFL